MPSVSLLYCSLQNPSTPYSTTPVVCPDDVKVRCPPRLSLSVSEPYGDAQLHYVWRIERKHGLAVAHALLQLQSRAALQKWRVKATKKRSELQLVFQLRQEDAAGTEKKSRRYQ